MGPSKRTRSPGLISRAKSEARVSNSFSEQFDSCFHRDGVFCVFNFFEGIADIINDIRCCHAPMSKSLCGKISSQTVEVNTQESGLKCIHPLTEQSSDHSSQDISAS